MQPTKLGKAAVVLSLGLLASFTAEATLITPPSEFDFKDQSTANIIAHVGSSIAMPGQTIIDLSRLDDLSSPGADSGFSITYGASGRATISWNLTGTGTELEGIYIFGGGSANLYGIASDGELTGSGSIVTPLNHGGQTPGISHILFLGTDVPSPSVPDGANTSLLLGASLLGLSLFKNRFLNQKQ